jgi:AbiV family abortive infection protein
VEILGYDDNGQAGGLEIYMQPRRVYDLASLCDSELFFKLAEGMLLCLQNALRLWRHARWLFIHDFTQSAMVIKLLAEEEAAKFHILLDAARCPREHIGKHLRRFNQHLARGLYVRYYEFTVMPLSEAEKYLRIERAAYYLDGPNDIDWIFRNDIERCREETMYVDYCKYSDAHEEKWEWRAPEPKKYRALPSVPPHVPGIIEAALLLKKCGLATPEGLRVTACFWRTIQRPTDLSLEEIRQTSENILNIIHSAQPPRRVQKLIPRVIESWRPPLWPLDLSRIEIDPEQLCERQKNWSAYGDGSDGW